jgi:hypothetical protein
MARIEGYYFTKGENTPINGKMRLTIQSNRSKEG